MPKRRSISSLKFGETVDLRFNGSKQFGNDPYSLTGLVFKGFTEDGNRATFSDDGSILEVYKFDRRWRYGTSAETLTLL